MKLIIVIIFGLYIVISRFMLIIVYDPHFFCRNFSLLVKLFTLSHFCIEGLWVYPPTNIDFILLFYTQNDYPKAE